MMLETYYSFQNISLYCDIWWVTDCSTNRPKSIYGICLDEAFQLKNYKTVLAVIIAKTENIQMICDILVGYSISNRM